MKNIIIIPTYNERENVMKLIPMIFSILPHVKVMIVDDSSPDGTAEVVKEMMARYPRLSLVEHGKKAGLGKAFIYAFKKVLREDDLDIVIMMDADFSYDPHALTTMLAVSEGCDVVVGSRYVLGGKTVGWELWRRCLSTFANMYSRVITKLPVKDITSGFNLIRTEMLRKVDFDSMDSSGYAFEIELKYFLYKNKARFREIPITFRNRVGGESKMSSHIIREGVLAPWKMRWKMRGKS